MIDALTKKRIQSLKLINCQIVAFIYQQIKQFLRKIRKTIKFDFTIQTETVIYSMLGNRHLQV